MASQAHHGAETVEMMWRSDGDHHIPTPVSFIPQVSRTILNPSRVSGVRSNRAGSARAPVAEGGGHDRPLPGPSRRACGYAIHDASPGSHSPVSWPGTRRVPRGIPGNCSQHTAGICPYVSGAAWAAPQDMTTVRPVGCGLPADPRRQSRIGAGHDRSPGHLRRRDRTYGGAGTVSPGPPAPERQPGRRHLRPGDQGRGRAVPARQPSQRQRHRGACHLGCALRRRPAAADTGRRIARLGGREAADRAERGPE